MPIDNNELRSLHDAINNGINNDLMIVITPEIIKICTKKLKPGKDDGDISFKSDHLIHGVINCMLYCLRYLIRC